MDTEIEIKFLVSGPLGDTLPDLLPPCRILEHDRQHLANTYFDTAELGLRRLGAGLRIRSPQRGELEQTVKLAGSQVGGLHQRPEYNVPLDVHNPDLSLFPASIWPDGADPHALQQGLQPLFCTDFMRHRWLIELNGTEIELALDEGEVQAGELREPIYELELELVRGTPRCCLSWPMPWCSGAGCAWGRCPRPSAATGWRGSAPCPNCRRWSRRYCSRMNPVSR
ncbi:CYTH domain-containing protein [Oceanimonas sp. NS1]|nr:CYTH domain-containing protein [Oceanimonas sp. NS1]